jgi:O-antigen ligase
VLLKTRKGWVALLSAGGIGLTAYANAFSFSRTGYASMVVSVLVFLLMPVGSLRKIAIVGVTAAAAAVAILMTPVDIIYRAWDIYWTLTGRRVAASFSQRLTLWGEAYRDFRANPLLGRGAWAYSTRDNFYVKLVAESGLLGLASFIGLLCVILRNEWRALMRYKKDDFVGGLAIGLFPASIGSLLIFNLAGDFFQVHRFIGIFWLVLALVLKSARGEGSVPYDGEEAAHSAVR